MFHSKPKPPAPLPSWGVQILTRDYLLEGETRPLSREYADEFIPGLLRSLKANTLQDLLRWTLVEGRARPASNLPAPPQTFARWTLHGRELLAVAPLDPPSQTALSSAFERYKYPFVATLFIGSYRVRGNLMLDGQDGQADLSTYVPMADAVFDCLLPGGQLAFWRAPWVLLNGVAVQGDVRDV